MAQVFWVNSIKTEHWINGIRMRSCLLKDFVKVLTSSRQDQFVRSEQLVVITDQCYICVSLLNSVTVEQFWYTWRKVWPSYVDLVHFNKVLVIPDRWKFSLRVWLPIWKKNNFKATRLLDSATTIKKWSSLKRYKFQVINLSELG